MNFSGIIWRTASKNTAISQGLKKYFQQIVKVTKQTVEKDSFILFTGKVSDKNDYDDVIETASLTLVGRIFDSVTYKRHSVDTFQYDIQNAEKISKLCWGKYVGFLYSTNNSHLEIIRDPTGQLPFYYHALADGNIIFSSDISIICDYLGKKPTLNRNYLSCYLLFSNTFITEETAFDTIYELPPGCKLTISAQKLSVASFWCPLIQTTDYQQNSEQYRQTLIETIRKTLKAWLAPYKNIVVSLSGGLDSSALLMCLNSIIKSDQKIIPINYYHSQVRTSNETHYAREVCQFLNLDLVEIDIADRLPFNLKSKLDVKPNRPQQSLISADQIMLISNLLEGHTSVFMNGEGGDHIFMRPPTEYAIADSFLEQGLRCAYGELKQIASYFRRPFLPVIFNNIRALLRYWFNSTPTKLTLAQYNKSPWMTETLLRNVIAPYAFKWDKSSNLPGKREHIEAYYQALPSLQIEHTDFGNPSFSPLLYQSIAELALKIATYDLYAEGHDRYPFRKATSQYFNTDLVWRRNKGETSGIIQLGLKTNFDMIRSLCLDGYFAKNNLIDTKSLNQELILAAKGQNRYIGPLINLITIELFLTYWK